MDVMEYVKLNNGVEMPILGFGVYQIPKEETKECVLNAIKVGYRLIRVRCISTHSSVWDSAAAELATSTTV